MQYGVTYPDINGEVRFPGLDMGSSKCIWWDSRPINIDQLSNGDTIVIKVTGGMHWSGRGEQSYAGTEFWVLRILEVKPADGHFKPHFICEKLIEIPVRKKNG